MSQALTIRFKYTEGTIIRVAAAATRANPVYYVQYSYARIAGILRNAPDNASAAAGGSQNNTGRKSVRYDQSGIAASPSSSLTPRRSGNDEAASSQPLTRQTSAAAALL